MCLVDLAARSGQILLELGVVVQGGDGGGAHDAALQDIALPVHVADQAAVAEGAAAGEQGVALGGCQLGQDQAPAPADRGELLSAAGRHPRGA